MKNERNAVRAAVDRRLSALQADPARREQIRQRIREESEPKMKRKMTVSLAFALVAVLALGGVALGLTMNLFEYFGEKDERLKEIAPQTVLTTEAPAEVETDELGKSYGRINSAYYDGQSLMVAYVLENTSRMESYTPTDEELSRMEKCDEVPVPAAENEIQAQMYEDYYTAVEAGLPCGFVHYSVYPSDHTETADGIDLPPAEERREQSEDGAFYMLREYESPLPEAAQDRDQLDICIRLHQTAYYVWFDGKDAYTRIEHQSSAGVMTATVPRAEADIVRFGGEAVWNGETVSVQAEASAVHVTVNVKAGQGALKEFSDDKMGMMVTLTDEDGQEYLLQSINESSDANRMECGFYGSGRTPAGLTLCIWNDRNGELDFETAKAEGLTIVLTPESK